MSNVRGAVFRFTAIVGQVRMRRALELNAVTPAMGGVLIRGEKGTAKSTAVRALARLLPEIDVVEGCHYSCEPPGDDGDSRLCIDCTERLARGETLGVTHRRVRGVQLPSNASEDRVRGRIDIESAGKTETNEFEPDVLAAADG